MKNKFKAITAIVILAILLGGAYLLYNNLFNKYDTNSQQQNLTDDEEIENDKAVDFLIYDENGNEVYLFDFFGKPVVVNFFASWCPPCKSELPYFNEAYQDYNDSVVFLMVDLVDGQRETKSSGLSYIESQGYEFEIYYDIDMAASEIYEVYSIPTTLFIDAQGNIVKRVTGAINSSVLNDSINLIYNGK